MIAPVPGDEARVGPTEWTGRRGEGDSGERGGGGGVYSSPWALPGQQSVF